MTHGLVFAFKSLLIQVTCAPVVSYSRVVPEFSLPYESCERKWKLMDSFIGSEERVELF